MIVTMKKLCLVTTCGRKDETLSNLRKLGVVHIDTEIREAEPLVSLLADRQALSDAYQYLLLFKENKRSKAPQKREDGKALAGEVLAMLAGKTSSEEEILSLRSEIERVLEWGDFDPEAFQALSAKGIELGLYQLPAEKLESLTCDYILIKIRKNTAYLVVIGKDDPAIQDFRITLPEQSLSGLRQALITAEQRIKEFDVQLSNFTVYKPVIKTALQSAEKALEFKRIALEMGQESALTWVIGFVPINQLDKLKAEAAKQSWGILLTDPVETDKVPTLLHNPKAIGIIQPIYDLLGITPGYRELDFSFWFLLSLGLFFAMIIGDAAYGCIMLGITILARMKMRKAPAQIFILLFVMSTCTIIWGALSGTWFGLEAFARLPLLENITIPLLASFPKPGSTVDTVGFIWNFCFVIGVVHLSIARLIAFFRKLPKPVALADLGWFLMLWGNFFLIRTMLLQKPFFPLTLWFIGIGLGLFILFSDTGTSLLKGILKGIAFSPLKVLNAVSGFADIISYIRLFAVGLASLEVAKAFNSIALGAGFGTIWSSLGAVIVLLLGHSMNILMSSMSIIVHGVRLNILEFSSHVGIEWAGNEYKPFKE